MAAQPPTHGIEESHMATEGAAALCPGCLSKMKIAGSHYVCENCGSTLPIVPEEPSVVRTRTLERLQTEKQQASERIFYLIIRKEWLDNLIYALQQAPDDQAGPDFTDCMVSEQTLELISNLRPNKGGSLPSREQLMEWVEDELSDELAEYRLMLVWRHVSNGIDAAWWLYFTPAPPYTII